MDYYNIDSEIIETLNILRPPVKRERKFKRGRRIDDTFIQYLDCGDSHVELVTDYSQEDQTEYCSLRDLKSSLSLILQRTSQRQIIEQYSVYSRQNSRNRIAGTPKPTVKVTVIPKSERKPLLKHLKKHKRFNKLVHATCSNQENSVPCKNVFIVVAGQENEKIYQIKASGSDNLTKHEVNHYKQVYTALKMERKKRKVRRTSSVELVDDGTDASSPGSCCCSYAGDSYNQRDLGAGRVRIVGRLGLNEHDKYILECAATINDKPVINMSEISPPKAEVQPLNVGMNSLNLDTSSSCESLPKCRTAGLVDVRAQTMDKETMTMRQEPPQVSYCYKRMANIDDLCRIISQEQRKRFNVESQTYNVNQAINPAKYYNNKKSQATQIDVRINEPVFTTEQSTQCYCNQPKTSTENSFQDNGSIESDSPLVIISVFPKQDGVKTVACTNFDKNQLSINKTINKVNALTDHQEVKKPKQVRPRSPYRSPSPTRKANKTVEGTYRHNIVAETRTVRTTERSRSPVKSTLSPRNVKPIQKDVMKQDKAKIKTIPSEKQRKNTSSRDQSINTDKIQTRNKSSDRFNKKVINQKQQVRSDAKSNLKEKIDKEVQDSTKNNKSRVSVNIKNENEFYDVVFEQNKHKTDLTVRKKVNADVKAFFKTDFMENTTLQEDNSSCRDKRSVSKSFSKTVDSRKPLAANEHAPRIKVKDSLEVVHRREGKERGSTQTKGIQEVNDSANETEFLAPIKHYTGDDCVIYDPVVRDKEIRALLGIQRINKNQLTVNQDLNGFAQYILTIPIQCEHLVTETKLNTVYTHVPRDVINEKIYGDANDKTKTDVIKDNENHNVSDSTIVREDIDKDEHKNKENKTVKCDENLDINIEKSLSDKTTKFKLHSCIVEANSRQKSILLSRKQYTKVKRSIRRLAEKRHRSKLNCIPVSNRKEEVKLKVHWDKDMQTDPIEKDKVLEVVEAVQSKSQIEANHDETIVIFSRHTNDKKINEVIRNEVRRIASSVEIRYTSAAVLKQTVCSVNNNVGSYESSKQDRNKQNSIETLYRVPKKSRTPNLGTSALSLLSEDEVTTTKSESVVPYVKKPFLRRLMSCLVMRSGKVEVKVPTKAPTANSSVNSYHFSTSLAGVEITSSLYDTTASFFSNHTIGPLKKRAIKRGFFSSVRGFLLSRRT